MERPDYHWPKPESAPNVVYGEGVDRDTVTWRNVRMLPSEQAVITRSRYRGNWESVLVFLFKRRPLWR